MRTRIVAAIELALILPAALFMSALVVREITLLPFGAAHTAQQVVMWYAGRMWTLWVLLLALPFTVLVTGCATLRHHWKHGRTWLENARQSLAAIRANLATLVVAATTFAAGLILAIVVLHMAAN